MTSVSFVASEYNGTDSFRKHAKGVDFIGLHGYAALQGK